MATRKRRKAVKQTSKNKKRLEFERRSKAAIKGWKTRRLAQELVSQAKKLSRKKTTVKVTREARRLERSIQRYAGTNYYNAEPIGWLHRDGTIAASFSELRHIAESQKIVLRLRRATEKALAEGITQWGEVSAFWRVAEEYDVPVREVFSLFFSP